MLDGNTVNLGSGRSRSAYVALTPEEAHQLQCIGVIPGWRLSKNPDKVVRARTWQGIGLPVWGWSPSLPSDQVWIVHIVPDVVVEPAVVVGPGVPDRAPAPWREPPSIPVPSWYVLPYTFGEEHPDLEERTRLEARLTGPPPGYPGHRPTPVWTYNRGNAGRDYAMSFVSAATRVAEWRERDAADRTRLARAVARTRREAQDVKMSAEMERDRAIRLALEREAAATEDS